MLGPYQFQIVSITVIAFSVQTTAFLDSHHLGLSNILTIRFINTIEKLP